MLLIPYELESYPYLQVCLALNTCTSKINNAYTDITIVFPPEPPPSGKISKMLQVDCHYSIVSTSQFFNFTTCNNRHYRARFVFMHTDMLCRSIQCINARDAPYTVAISSMSATIATSGWYDRG